MMIRCNETTRQLFSTTCRALGKECALKMDCERVVVSAA